MSEEKVDYNPNVPPVASFKDDADVDDTPTVPMPPKFDQRVDEFAADVFEVLGYDKLNLPPKLVELYQEMKYYKDRLSPGRLTYGEFAFITMLAKLYDAGPEK